MSRFMADQLVSLVLQHQREDKDFIWTYTEEPHRSRRLQIMQSHPEVLFITSTLAFALLSLLLMV